MNDYFQHDFLSNSDIKDFLKKIGLKREDPENLQEIFDLGTLIHATILEPHLSDKKHDQYEMALAMRDTFWADPTCRGFAIAPDFHRESPFFEERKVGQYKVKLRCKCDGVRSRLGIMLELKGLSVDNEKAFREALIRYDYDQAAAHYMITGDFRMCLIVGISKKDPKKLFKWYIKRHDEFYLGGEQKLLDSLTLLRDYSPSDVLVA